jgi:hypothetical protein
MRHGAAHAGRAGPCRLNHVEMGYPGSGAALRVLLLFLSAGGGFMEQAVKAAAPEAGGLVARCISAGCGASSAVDLADWLDLGPGVPLRAWSPGPASRRGPTRRSTASADRERPRRGNGEASGGLGLARPVGWRRAPDKRGRARRVPAQRENGKMQRSACVRQSRRGRSDHALGRERLIEGPSVTVEKGAGSCSRGSSIPHPVRA